MKILNLYLIGNHEYVIAPNITEAINTYEGKDKNGVVNRVFKLELIGSDVLVSGYKERWGDVK